MSRSPFEFFFVVSNGDIVGQSDVLRLEHNKEDDGFANGLANLVDRLAEEHKFFLLFLPKQGLQVV